MAQCKLDPRAEAPFWNGQFLANCMQAKGYIRDDTLPYSKNAWCADIMTAGQESECYRADS